MTVYDEQTKCHMSHDDALITSNLVFACCDVMTQVPSQCGASDIFGNDVGNKTIRKWMDERTDTYMEVVGMERS